MSEYQYYEFLALDQPLSERQMLEVREFSSRAKITPTSFVNEYNFGDFRGDVKMFLTKYYDAFVYVANWGTHRLCFRLPKSGMDASAIKRHCRSDYMTLRSVNGNAILELWSESEEGDWDDGEAWMSSLAPLRADVLAGDLRCLYLGWLNCIGCEDAEENEKEGEPPVPAGLGTLSAPLKALAEFLRIDTALIEAAAEASPSLAQTNDTAAEFRSWIKTLSPDEKDSLLARLAQESPPVVQREMMGRFRRERNAVQALPDVGKRTVGQLLAAWNQRRQERQRLAAEKKAREEARRKEEAAKARQKHLDDLARREPHAWQEAESLIQTRQPNKYDAAVQLLRDLRDLAEREGKMAEATVRLGALRRMHGSKPSLLRRLNEAKL